ncbi:hypothetical protein HYX04_05575 [Candidatus Woesearchaeota archaeon]|nr:hypothetical protein [Candidatus Woesearchaeota archaeon]
MGETNKVELFSISEYPHGNARVLEPQQKVELNRLGHRFSEEMYHKPLKIVPNPRPGLTELAWESFPPFYSEKETGNAIRYYSTIGKSLFLELSGRLVKDAARQNLPADANAYCILATLEGKVLLQYVRIA